MPKSLLILIVYHIVFRIAATKLLRGIRVSLKLVFLTEFGIIHQIYHARPCHGPRDNDERKGYHVMQAFMEFSEKQPDEHVLRFANREDIPIILRFIKELAEYEHLADQVVATEESLGYWLFDQHKAEVLLAVHHGEAVGFALFFHNFSTFLGKAGIYLEDLYVRSEARGQGYGKALLRKLARLTVERGCGRLEWNCLDWNQPSIDFYRSLGAVPMEDWTLYRLTGTPLKELADTSRK